MSFNRIVSLIIHRNKNMVTVILLDEGPSQVQVWIGCLLVQQLRHVLVKIKRRQVTSPICPANGAPSAADFHYLK